MMSTRSSAKREREQDLQDSRPSKRPEHADSERLLSDSLKSIEEASERVKLAARVHKRPHRQSQANFDSRTASEEDISSRQQVSDTAYCFLTFLNLCTTIILSFAPESLAGILKMNLHHTFTRIAALV